MVKQDLEYHDVYDTRQFDHFLQRELYNFSVKHVSSFNLSVKHVWFLLDAGLLRYQRIYLMYGPGHPHTITAPPSSSRRPDRRGSGVITN
ncbi:hypothetical protein RRG08_003544 [Elysia crispata]|uniref:Uncharacterized protein n=1 Tax=Elysia crispata TaxID=231223 RepID=A0AAE0Y710_9GAST|nr:hypothetical protein RRG08_003544 [Elysia crispata]